MSLLAAGFFHYLFAISMSLIAVFLILLVLVQRGRGGGLAGAFGGLGGQSAFGAKAGDLFTRITMVAAFLWIALCMTAIRVLNAPSSRFGGQSSGVSTSAPAEQDGAAPAEQGSSDSSSGGAPSGGTESGGTDTPAPSDQ
jgi:preprotein translocase subunit SecG